MGGGIVGGGSVGGGSVGGGGEVTGGGVGGLRRYFKYVRYKVERAALMSILKVPEFVCF